MNDTVFAVPVFDRWLIHAPLHEITALVNHSMVETLKAGPVRGRKDSFNRLCGLLSGEPPAIPRANTGPLRPDFLGIIPTRSCNLNCVYCAFASSGTCDDTMEFSLAAAAVSWMADYIQETGQNTLEIHFFGGEPFVASEVVDVTVHKARLCAQRYGLKHRFEISTNGFFDDSRCLFVGDYFDTVVLSMDGPEEIHDRYRRGSRSFATVAGNAHRLSTMPVELCIRACVTQETVGRLDHILSWLCTNFKPSSISFEPLQPSPENDGSGLYPPDPWTFAASFFRSYVIAESHGVDLIYSSALVHTVRHTFCPVGRDTIIVSPDGRISACYLLENEWTKRDLDLNMGNIDSAGNVDFNLAAIERIRNLTSLGPRCRHCLARWHCAGACHVNHSYPGCSVIFNDVCIQTRILTVCLLLYELGYQSEAERLLDDRLELEHLVYRASDCLVDWGEYED